MTMLEKMARAMVAAQGDDYDAVSDIGRRNAQAEARAVLEAIRDANERMVKAGVWCGSDGKTVFAGEEEDAMRLAWKDMIDVILSGRA